MRAQTIDTDVDLARASDLFETAGLDPSILPSLGLTARTVMPGAALVKAGDTGHEAFLLVEGRLRVSIDIAGAGEEALAILRPGEIVGEMPLVDDAPRSADVYAHGGPAVVYVLTRDVFQRLLRSGAAEGAPLLGGLDVPPRAAARGSDQEGRRLPDPRGADLTTASSAFSLIVARTSPAVGATRRRTVFGSYPGALNSTW